MNNSTAEQAIRKVANSLINTHRPQLGACHSVAVESSLEALAELADELSLFDIYAELTKRLDILRGGQRPPVLDGLPVDSDRRSAYADGFNIGFAEASIKPRKHYPGIDRAYYERGLAEGRRAFVNKSAVLLNVDMAGGQDSTAVFAHELNGGAQ